jgi:hypothetical protein
MKMPGFTAEASLYNARKHFKSIEYSGNYTGAQVIIPQTLHLVSKGPYIYFCGCDDFGCNCTTRIWHTLK